MKVLVTGVGGQLGCDVVKELLRRGIPCVGSGRGAAAPAPLQGLPYAAMDITDRAQVAQVMAREAPDAVIHCAAWTAVDAAEAEANRAAVYAVNVLGTEHLAQECASRGCRLLYLSTDYVFGGGGTEPWRPECRDFAPLNYYGETKLTGERAVERLTDAFFIVRTAWVFGANGQNFIRTMLRLAETHDTLRVVCDQIGTPTYTRDLARLLADMIVTERYGYYHATNEGGYLSWYDLACAVFRQAGRDVRVIPVTTEEYGLSAAARPRNSRLDKSRLAECGFARLPAWDDALARYLKELDENANEAY